MTISKVNCTVRPSEKVAVAIPSLPIFISTGSTVALLGVTTEILNPFDCQSDVVIELPEILPCTSNVSLACDAED
ncbi:hypothetical protein ACUIJP_07375 [Leuconostoc pseudomesenteroides]|uniref:hypothetical protein n=1 Tax=Leuconostoc pseudomesenteroides TaxID=33968 RepID=UPI00403DF107